MKRGAQLSLIVAGAMLCAAGILTYVVHEVWGGKIPPFPKLGAVQQLGAIEYPSSTAPLRPALANLGDTLQSAAPSDGIIREDMSIFWVTHYSTCGHEKVRELPPAPETIGWTYERYAQYYSGYTLSKLGSNLRMERTINQYCPDHYIIKSDDSGAIYVYRNVDGQDTLSQLARMSFTIDQVPQDYRQLLKDGMAFGSIEEIEGLIEDAET